MQVRCNHDDRHEGTAQTLAAAPLVLAQALAHRAADHRRASRPPPAVVDGLAFQFTTWCRFETVQRKNDMRGDAIETLAPGWQRYDGAGYHDSTATGRY